MVTGSGLITSIVTVEPSTRGFWLLTSTIIGGEFAPASTRFDDSDGGITQPPASSTTASTYTVGVTSCSARASRDPPCRLGRLARDPGLSKRLWSDICVMAGLVCGSHQFKRAPA